MKNGAILRRPLAILITALLCFMGSSWTGETETKSTSDPASELDTVIANAKSHSDAKGVRRATNLKAALARLKPSDLNGIRCGKADADTTKIDVDRAQDVVGKLLDKALEKYLPALATALASTAAAAVAVFLTPEKIGPDSVEILNNSEKYPRADVTSAARQILQDTMIERFPKLSKRMTATIVACVL